MIALVFTMLGFYLLAREIGKMHLVRLNGDLTLS